MRQPRAGAGLLAGFLILVPGGVALGTTAWAASLGGSIAVGTPVAESSSAEVAEADPEGGCVSEVPACTGDCNSNAEVTVDEVVRSVLIALGALSIDVCRNVDFNGDQQVTIDELVLSVRRLLEGCPVGSGALYEVRACEESFRVLLCGPLIEEAEKILAGVEPQKIVTGPLRAGNGNFNGPWQWHLEPRSTGFAEITIELCDGCPSYVEEHLPEWLEVVRRYCPWSAQLVRRIR